MPRQIYDCRFCLEIDEKRNLLAPCFCKGSYKYVHNTCLIEWYNHEPLKGHSCNVCSYMYQMEHTSPIETWQNVRLFLHIHLYYPFLSILITHWACISCFAYTHILFDDSLYMLYQFLWHIGMGLEYMYAVYGIKNRRVYAMYWKKYPRCLLPVIHSYFLLFLPKTGILGGMAANMCMMYYFYEHYEIINSMNTNVRMRFLSRQPV